MFKYKSYEFKIHYLLQQEINNSLSLIKSLKYPNNSLIIRLLLSYQL